MNTAKAKMPYPNQRIKNLFALLKEDDPHYILDGNYYTYGALHIRRNYGGIDIFVAPGHKSSGGYYFGVFQSVSRETLELHTKLGFDPVPVKALLDAIVKKYGAE